MTAKKTAEQTMPNQMCVGGVCFPRGLDLARHENVQSKGSQSKADEVGTEERIDINTT